jgi:hypothetical protein
MACALMPLQLIVYHKNKNKNKKHEALHGLWMEQL